jgi:hypothetical protein
MKYIKSLSEKEKLKWHDSDAPDAEGRFRDLSPKDLAAWLIKTRKGDMKKISGSLSQQVAFNKNDDPEYVKKMDKTRKEVYKQLDREDLLESVLNEEETYNDYPAAAKKNAQMAIDWKEKYGRDEVPAGTPVGWARAHQLAKGEKISADTVKRMSAFNRHRKNSSIAPEHKDEPWKDNGYVAWLIWGGDEGVDWAIEKSKEIDAMKEANQMRFIKPLNEFKTNEAKMPDKYIGNDDIVYLKTKEDSRGAHYNLYYKGHDIDFGGRRFGSEKELEDFASNYILSNQLYKKLRYADAKPLPESVVNESYWSGYDYDKWTKENGKPKYPKWVKTTLKEIVKGGFMDPVYDSEHMYMVLWLGSFDNQRRSELFAYDKKGKKEFGNVGYKLARDKWNDLTGYTMFSMMGAMYALEVSKHIQDRIANGEPVEPAYYMMKEYFNNFGMDTKRSRIFNAAYEKLEKWMKDNQIQTL